MIKSWPEDGGAFLTLPLVLTQSPDQRTLPLAVAAAALGVPLAHGSSPRPPPEGRPPPWLLPLAFRVTFAVA